MCPCNNLRKTSDTMKIKKFEFNMFPVNTYVLSDESGEAVVIDPGCFYPEEKQMLKDYLSDNNLTLKHVFVRIYIWTMYSEIHSFFKNMACSLKVANRMSSGWIRFLTWHAVSVSFTRKSSRLWASTFAKEISLLSVALV